MSLLRYFLSFSLFSPCFFLLFFSSLCLDGPAVHPIYYDWMDIGRCAYVATAHQHIDYIGCLELFLATPTLSLRLDDYAASSHAPPTHRRHSSLHSSRFALCKRKRSRLGHEHSLFVYMHCARRARGWRELRRWRRGEALDERRAAYGRSTLCPASNLACPLTGRMGWSTSSRRLIFEDAECGRASILSTRRSKARRSMSGRRQICDWRCYRHGGRHVWVRLVVIQCFSISRRMSSHRTCGWWGAVLVAASYLGVSGRLCSALLCDR